MFHDTWNQDILTIRDGIHFTLASDDIAINKDWVVWTCLNGCTHVRTKVIFIFNDFHGTSTQNVWRTNKNWEANLTSCFNRFFFICRCLSWWLWDIEVFKGLFKKVTVFGTVKVSNLCSQDFHTSFRQWLCQVDGCLTTKLNHDTLRLFQFDNVHHVFEGQWFEVKFIWNWEVCWNRLRVRVHDDGFVTCSLDSFHRVNCRIVEFNPLSDTDRSWTKNDDRFFIRFDWFIFPLVSWVEIWCWWLELSRTGINHLVNRNNVIFQTCRTNLVSCLIPKISNLTIRETVTFSFFQNINIAYVSSQFLFQFEDMEQFVEEEDINLSQLWQFFNSITTTDGFRKVEETVVLSFDNLFNQGVVCDVRKLRHFIVVNTDFKWTAGFKKWFFDVTTDSHNFTCCFHLSTKTTFTVFKFIKWETWNLSNHIVKSWFKHSVSCTSDWVNHFIKCQTNSDLGCQFGDWVTSCFWGKGWWTWYTRVYFDNIVLEAIRVKSQLYVTATLNFKGTDNLQAGITKHLVFNIWQGLRWGKYDWVPCVDTNWVKIFHVTYHKSIVRGITHNFVFDFLETSDRTLNQTLCYWWQFQAIFSDFTKFFFVGTHTTTSTTKGKGRTHDNWVTNFCRKGNCFFNRIDNFRFWNRLFQIFHQLFEEVTVFGLVNGRQFCSQKLYSEFFKNTSFWQFHCHVQTSLSPKCWQEGIRTLFTKNTCDKFKRNWFNVNLICDFFISHDCRRVRVDKDNTVTFFFQGQAGLRTSVVELSSLTNDDRTRPDNHNFFNIRTFRHNLWYKAR